MSSVILKLASRIKILENFDYYVNLRCQSYLQDDENITVRKLKMLSCFMSRLEISYILTYNINSIEIGKVQLKLQV